MTVWPLDNADYTAAAIGAYNGTRTRGVFSADDCFRVSSIGGRGINLSGGLAWLQMEKYWGIAVREPNDTTWELDVASGVMNRYVAVVIQMDKVANIAQPLIRYGDYAADNPQIPQPVRDEYYDEIIVAAVLQRAAATDITTADITDTRTDEQYCGIMRDGVTGIPTQQLAAQAQQLIGQLREELAAVNDGSLFAVVIDSMSTLPASGWSDTAPYTQTVDAPRMAAIYEPIADIVLTGAAADKAAQLEAWSAVSEIVTGAGTITAMCLEDRPECNIQIRLKAVT